MGTKTGYTCAHYREEMILLGLKRRLAQGDLSEEGKRKIRKEIEKRESAMLVDR